MRERQQMFRLPDERADWREESGRCVRALWPAVRCPSVCDVCQSVGRSSGRTAVGWGRLRESEWANGRVACLVHVGRAGAWARGGCSLGRHLLVPGARQGEGPSFICAPVALPRGQLIGPPRPCPRRPRAPGRRSMPPPPPPPRGPHSSRRRRIFHSSPFAPFMRSARRRLRHSTAADPPRGAPTPPRGVLLALTVRAGLIFAKWRFNGCHTSGCSKRGDVCERSASKYGGVFSSHMHAWWCAVSSKLYWSVEELFHWEWQFCPHNLALKSYC